MFPFMHVMSLYGVYVITIDTAWAFLYAVALVGLLAVAVPYLATSRQPVPRPIAWTGIDTAWKWKHGGPL